MFYFYLFVWILFLYVLYLWIYLIPFYFVICFWIIVVFFAIISEYGYKKYYKIEKKAFQFFLYPLSIIICLWMFLFFPFSQTGIYEFKINQKEIIFFGMNHIGTQKYYTSLTEKIITKKNECFVVVYEWIKMTQNQNSPTYKELETIFENTKILTNKFFLDQDIYQEKWIWKNDINIDLSSEDIEKLSWWNTLEKIPKYTILRQWDKKIKYVFNKYFLNKYDAYFLSAFYNYWLFLSETTQNEQSVLIHERNKHLLSEIEKLSNQKIIIIYWEWHWKDFYQKVHTKYPETLIKNTNFFLPFQQ